MTVSKLPVSKAFVGVTFCLPRCWTAYKMFHFIQNLASLWWPRSPLPSGPCSLLSISYNSLSLFFIFT